MINEQVAQEVFYGIPQPGHETKIDAIKTILKNYKIQILVDQEPKLLRLETDTDEHGNETVTPIYVRSFIFIGVPK